MVFGSASHSSCVLRASRVTWCCIACSEIFIPCVIICFGDLAVWACVWRIMSPPSFAPNSHSSCLLVWLKLHGALSVSKLARAFHDIHELWFVLWSGIKIDYVQLTPRCLNAPYVALISIQFLFPLHSTVAAVMQPS